MNALVVFGAAMILVGILFVVVGVVHVGGPDPAHVVSRALFKEPRFLGVGVGLSGSIMNLSGSVKTSNDKWDARSVAWHALGDARVVEKVEAIFNNIVSEETDAMPPPPPGFIDNATGWRILR